jgi:predicted acetyltransferase
VRAWLPPDDPVLWLLTDAAARLTSDHSWAVRVADASAAITARGFPDTVELSVPLVIEDAGMPANQGCWQLILQNGKGRLEPVSGAQARDALVLGARGLSALYAGVPLAVLRRTGLLPVGSTEFDSALDTAFATRPYVLDTW